MWLCLIICRDTDFNHTCESSRGWCVRGAYERLDDMLDDLALAMDPSAFCPSGHKLITESDYRYSLEKQTFENAVNEVKEFIQAGDVMQTVLSQRITVPYAESPCPCIAH